VEAAAQAARTLASSAGPNRVCHQLDGV